jgi:hypothetical protein
MDAAARFLILFPAPSWQAFQTCLRYASVIMGVGNTVSRTLHSSATRFRVDDVQTSAERLGTSELLAVVRDRIHRGVLLGPLAGRRVLDVDYSSNPLVSAAHLAFSRHLPLTLSPDAIWLTVIQGLSHHINQNAEAFRGRLVRHQGRVALAEEIQQLTIGDVQKAVSGFSRQIRAATDPALHDALICDFSTTTADVRTASEIALMDTYSHYFEYSMGMCICGIPHVTLTGSAEDWRRIRDRVELIDTFELGWWTERLRPILDQFVRAAEGRPDTQFWRGIYKFRPRQGPYDSTKVTGWLVDLFPYLRDAPLRARNHVFDAGAMPELRADQFPSGFSSVPVVLRVFGGDRELLQEHELELLAGLLAVEQDEKDGALSPTISWCLTRRAPAQAEIHRSGFPFTPPVEADL